MATAGKGPAALGTQPDRNAISALAALPGAAAEAAAAVTTGGCRLAPTPAPGTPPDASLRRRAQWSPDVAEEELAALIARPQHWGKSLTTVVRGVQMDIKVPTHYGAAEMSNPFPLIVALEASVAERVAAVEKATEDFDETEEGILPRSVSREQAQASLPMLPSVALIVRPGAVMSRCDGTDGAADSGGAEWCPDDLKPVAAAVREAVTHLSVSTRRLYVIGVGKGAALAAALASTAPGYFAAAVFVQPHRELSTFERTYKRLLETMPCWRLCTSPDELAAATALVTSDRSLAKPTGSSKATLIDDFMSAETMGRLLSVTAVLVDPRLHSWLIESAQPLDLSAQRAKVDAAARLRAAADFAEVNRDCHDVYGRGTGLSAFESEVAARLGKEEGIFFPSGTCANQAAVRVAVNLAKVERVATMAEAEDERPLSGHAVGAGIRKSRVHAGSDRMSRSRSMMVQLVDVGVVVVHWTSHLVHLGSLGSGAEQRDNFSRNAVANFLGADVLAAGLMHKVITYRDLIVHLRDESWKPAAIVIEMPQRMNGGGTMSWEDLKMLRQVCMKRGVHLHMDGARLWEVQPYYARPFAEICAQFDSVYVSFYKGMGALAGAMLLGDKLFIRHSMAERQRLGGQLYTFAPMWIDCKLAYDANVASFLHRFDRLCRVVDLLKEAKIVYPGGPIRFVPETPQSAMIHVYLMLPKDMAEAAQAAVWKSSSIRVFDKIRGEGHPQFNTGVFPSACYFEWTMGELNSQIADMEVVEGFDKLLSEINMQIDAKSTPADPQPPSPVAPTIQKSVISSWLEGLSLELAWSTSIEKKTPSPVTEKRLPVDARGTINMPLCDLETNKDEL